MERLYQSIEVPFSIDIDLKKFIRQQTRCGIELLPNDVHRWIEFNINAVVLWTEVFYLPPYHSYDIHCDGHEVDNKCKLNYIINGDDSTIYWYRAVDINKIISSYSKSNTKYLKLEKNNAEEIGQATLMNFNLVNVGDFHTVVNGKNDRWCISIVVADKNSKERLNYDEVKSRLNTR
jgi:hypothetical protein